MKKVAKATEDTVFQISDELEQFYLGKFHCSTRTLLPGYSVSGQPDGARILLFF